MKRFIFVFLVALFSTVGLAQDRYQGLTAKQQADLDIRIAQLRSQNIKVEGQDNIPRPIIVNDALRGTLPAEPPVSTAKVAKEWAEIGVQLAVALTSTAKELGMVANDFVKTPVGMMTAGVIVYNYMGRDMIRFATRIGGGIVFGVIFLILWIIFVRRILLVKSITFVDHPVEIGIFKFTRTKKRVEYNSYGDMSGEMIFLGLLTFVIGVATTSIMILSF